MAAPTVRVRIGFTANEITLDGLVRGILDTGQVGGAVTLTDVTTEGQSVTGNRGRSRDLDRLFNRLCHSTTVK